MNRFALVLVTLLASLVVAPTGASADVQLDELASSLAGTPVTVQCLDWNEMAGAPGFVWTWEDDAGGIIVDPTIYLAGEYCGWIHYAQIYAGSQGRLRHWAIAMDNFYWIGGSLLLLQHEALHIRMKSGDEGLVECAAIRNVWNLTRRFGFDQKLLHDVYQGALDQHASQHAPYRAVC